MCLLDKNLRHEVKGAEKLDHERRKLFLKQREKDELAAAKKLIKKKRAKVVDDRQGSQLQRLLDSPFGAPPPLQKTGLSEEVSLLTVKVSVLKLPHQVVLILGFMCPQLTRSLLSMLSVLMQS